MAASIIGLKIFLILSLSHQGYSYNPKGMMSKDAILSNAPWSIKLLLLKDINLNKNQRPRNDFMSRRVGMESLVLRRQEDTVTPPSDDDPVLPPQEMRDDDSNMRLKLFRLMYETVRDSDLKVKRAELIRKHYVNSTAFEVGFLMGEVQEKYDIIVEFSGTLKKFYHKWKPIEHINAYEQIANYGIQINHLTDLIRTISKNGSLT
ncbi:unnamed protein product [Arctia plantaginis]|uniref:Uncharacterized protein n=1 Tax=Arctia plantaginis TaxID=874455 RepID=A0A8S1B2W5_ARCPL|nr:unnamed protein product [Arctia plantaginis]